MTTVVIGGTTGRTMRVTMIADGSSVVDGRTTSGEEASAGAVRAVNSGVDLGCEETMSDLCDLTGMGETCITDVGMRARGTLSLQLSGCASMMM